MSKKSRRKQIQAIKRFKATRGIPRAPENMTEPGKRYDWLSKIINERRYKIGAEIGCANGRTTGTVLENCPNVIIYAVDLWKPVPDEVGGGTQYKKWNFRRIKVLFNKRTRPNRNRLRILEGISWEMANEVEDNSLDFIFIDADHEYPSVIKDIKAWTPKLKSHGMISGHDTHFKGVLLAINEIIPGWKRVGIDHVWIAQKEDVLL